MCTRCVLEKKGSARVQPTGCVRGRQVAAPSDFNNYYSKLTAKMLTRQNTAEFSHCTVHEPSRSASHTHALDACRPKLPLLGRMAQLTMNLKSGESA